MARNENMIAALRRERALYVTRGDEDRVAQVDEQLHHHGAEVDEELGPVGRSGPEAAQQTTDAAQKAGGRRARPGKPSEPQGTGSKE